MDESPSPKFHEKEGEPAHPEGVTSAAKTTARGAVPEEGAASAAHSMAQGAMAVTLPVFVQLWPP